MHYRKFKALELSQLGFGAMRLPTLSTHENTIDKKAAATCIQTAIDHGVNYFDTAWPYHNGESEPFLGDFFHTIKQRNAVYLATKLPCWACHKPEDFMHYLDKQLKHLQTDHIDFYLLHALDAYRFGEIERLGIRDFISEAKRSGKIRYIGFSFHDLPQAFEPILNACDFDFVQIQLNYMDEFFQAGLQGMTLAAQKGCGVMIMEPLRGGQLAQPPKGELKTLWDAFHTNLTPAELGLKYLFNKPEITCVLSGMSQLDQVQENLITAERYTVNTLTQKETHMIEALQKYYRACIQVPCTGCRYCVECPQIIPIPSIFKYYNEAFMYGTSAASRKSYRALNDQFKGSACIGCGTCEKHCPQNIAIRDELKKAHSFLIKE